MSRELEVLIIIIAIILMVAYAMTGIYIFGQIAATVATLNFAVSTVRCMEKHPVDEREVKK